MQKYAILFCWLNVVMNWFHLLNDLIWFWFGQLFVCVCAADGALRIDISVHENDLENMAKGKRLFELKRDAFLTNY